MPVQNVTDLLAWLEGGTYGAIAPPKDAAPGAAFSPRLRSATIGKHPPEGWAVTLHTEAGDRDGVAPTISEAFELALDTTPMRPRFVRLARARR